MKTLSTITLVLLVTFANSQSLQLIGKKTLTIPDSTDIRVRTIEGDILRGEMFVLTDSTIAISSDTITLSSIAKVWPRYGVGRAVGAALISAGSALLIVSASYAVAIQDKKYVGWGLQDLYDRVIIVTCIVAGTPMVAIGTVVSHKRRGYSTTKYKMGIFR